ncbi:hypothetical protein ACU8M5_10780 [Rhizobium leguminosarum]
MTLAAIIAFTLGPNSAAFAANVLEKAIIAAQPCRPLKIKETVLGVKVDVGIDRLDYVKIDTVDIQVDGDAAKASALGTLACKTSDQAVVTGGISAKAQLNVQANLSTCVMEHSSIEIIETGGEFGGIVNEFKDEISVALLKGIENALKKLCES